MIASLFLSLSSFVVLFREMTRSSLLMMYLLLLHDSHSRPLTCISSPCIFGPRNGCAGKLTYTVSTLHAGELIPASACALRILQYLLTESALLRVPFAMACNIPGTYFFWYRALHEDVSMCFLLRPLLDSFSPFPSKTSLLWLKGSIASRQALRLLRHSCVPE